jgi:hypothetical protein
VQARLSQKVAKFATAATFGAPRNRKAEKVGRERLAEKVRPKVVLDGWGESDPLISRIFLGIIPRIFQYVHCTCFAVRTK